MILIEARTLSRMIRSVVVATNRKCDAGSFRACVLVEYYGGSQVLRLVGTDGHRLHMAEARVAGSIGFAAVVLGTDLEATAKALATLGEDLVEVDATTSGGLEIAARSMPGAMNRDAYPKYAGIVPAIFDGPESQTDACRRIGLSGDYVSDAMQAAYLASVPRMVKKHPYKVNSAMVRAPATHGVVLQVPTDPMSPLRIDAMQEGRIFDFTAVVMPMRM